MILSQNNKELLANVLESFLKTVFPGKTFKFSVSRGLQNSLLKLSKCISLNYVSLKKSI